jgi:hypothetical protein
MISHQYKTIFVHQRKCAGSSIIASFGIDDADPGRHFMTDGSLSGDYHYWKNSPWLPAYYKFAVVRNPWDRFVSGWLYCENLRDRPMRDVLRHLPQLEHDYVHVTRLQRSTLFDASGYLIVDRVIPFENLQLAFDEVCRTIGKPLELLPHALKNETRRHYSEYFEDPTDRGLFMRHFALDVDTFEYSF